MEIEAPSIPMPSIVAPAIEAGPSFSAPSFSVGGSASVTSEVAPPGGFHSVLDFGPELKASGDIFSQDRTISTTESIFNEGLFETLAKPQVSKETSTPDEFFGPKLETIGAFTNEGSVSQEEFGSLATEESFVAPIFPREKRPKMDEVGENILARQHSSWEILLGAVVQPVTSGVEKKEESEDLVNSEEVISTEEKTSPQVKGKVKITEKTTAENETETLPQVAISQDTGGGRRMNVGVQEEDWEEKPEEPKEPLWEASGKMEKSEEVAKRVLERRIKVAQEIVKESAQELAEEGNNDKLRLASRVVTRLGKIDTPTFKEAIGMVFGRLIFPLVGGRAARELYSLKANDLGPEGIFASLHQTLIKDPPLKPKEESMEKKGSLPESKLENLSKEAAVLAKEGAKHIVYDPQLKAWVSVEKKLSSYPLELDKTKNYVPVRKRNESIDTQKSLWYTLFAQRAQARANRRKAIF